MDRNNKSIRERMKPRLELAEQYIQETKAIENKKLECYSDLIFNLVYLRLLDNCFLIKENSNCDKCKEFYKGKCFRKDLDVKTISNEIGRYYPEKDSCNI